MNVAQMTTIEFKELLEMVIEQKFLELISNNENDLPLQQNLYARLLQQKQAIANGERGQAFADVIQQLDLG